MAKTTLAGIVGITIIVVACIVTVGTMFYQNKVEAEAGARCFDKVQNTKNGAIAYIRDGYPNAKHPVLYVEGDMIYELPSASQLLNTVMEPETSENIAYPTKATWVRWISPLKYTTIEAPVIRVILTDIDGRRVLDAWEKRRDGSWDRLKNPM